MNHLKIYYIILLLAVTAWSCSDEDVIPVLEELRNENFDLFVISESNPNVTVSFKAAASDLSSVIVNITQDGGTEPIATNTLKNIKASSLNRVTLNVPFPLNDVAPSGVYTVSFDMVSSSGSQSQGEYQINVINNREPVVCTYTSDLPSDKTVWVRLYVPEGASLPDDDDDIFITGSFGTREGGSDWDGGGQGASPFKFTEIDNTCYEIAMNLEQGDQFKITRGDWPKEMTLGNGAVPDNYTYNGESVIQITAFNWSDLPVVTPEVSEVLNIPADAVKPGMLTVVAELPDDFDVNDGDYYAVEQGATNLDNAFKMTAFEADSKLAAAVPKNASAQYIIVKNSADAFGVNSFGFAVPAVSWDGNTNPVRTSMTGFETEFSPPFVINELLLVGGATPAGWDNSAGNSQLLTQTETGKFTITVNFTNGSGGFLLIPDIGNWDSKIGKVSGDFLSGSLDFGASDFDAPGDNPEGMYKLDIDFINGSYTLTPQ